MGIEEFARVTNRILSVEINKLNEDWIVISVPVGGYKDAKKGYPEVRMIFQGSSPERRILKILDIERIGNGYELVAMCVPDYERLTQDYPGSGQKETLLLYENDKKGIKPNLEFLAGQDEYIDLNVAVQTALAFVFGKDKDVRRHITM